MKIKELMDETECSSMEEEKQERQIVRVDVKRALFLLLGAVTFPKAVPQLKRLGVGGVITLNESYETLAHGIDHLVIPTRNYLFASSFADISWVEYKHMTPVAALEYVRSQRPRFTNDKVAANFRVSCLLRQLDIEMSSRVFCTEEDCGNK
ncbi:unnamed protein product [Lupinus luteus]|uniref:Uncharacterized protein n=1 Tax=Lupinus luteus TaxID=3873 RepID=A0AAV1WYS1_LUPLU